MAFEIWKHSTQLAQFYILIPLTPLGFVFTALRFYATHRGGRKPGLEDWMAAIAALFFGLTNMAAIGAIIILNGREIEVEIAESPSDYRRMREWDMVGLYSYFIHTLTVKLSVLALYYRIFSINRSFKAWIYGVASAQTILVITFCVLQSQICKPFQRYFDRSIPGTCKDDALVVLSGETPNSLIDFVMVILAIVMIRSLNLSSVIKWKLYLLFGVGSVVGIFGFIKVAVTYSTVEIYAFSLVSLLTCIQMFLSILCCCLPVFHPILPSTGFWGRLSSRMLSYATFGRAKSVSQQSKTASKRGPVEPRTGQGWEHLDESNSSQRLAWPDVTHHTEALALNNYPLEDVEGEPQNQRGIKVQRQFVVS